MGVACIFFVTTRLLESGRMLNRIIRPAADSNPGHNRILLRRSIHSAPARARNDKGGIMEIVYYTLVAAGLYFMSDCVLQRLAARRGASFKHRHLVYFAILLTL